MLVLKFEIVNSTDCKSFYIKDTTGIYNVNSNPTGYGAPNETVGDCTVASITILLADGTSKVFNNTNGFYPLLPNTSGVLFQVTNVMLGLDASTPITDWISYMTYAGTFATKIYTSSKYCFIGCQSKCCVDTMLNKINFDEDCDCSNANFQRWAKGNAMLSAINSSLNSSPQLPNRAISILSSLTEFCAKQGCSCS